MTTAGQACDMGLIIPTRDEFDYLRKSIPFTPIRSEDKGFWYEFDIPGNRRGVAHVLFDRGLTATAATASRLLQIFGPEMLTVVGIGGALSANLRLGDVVVASAIHEYLKDAKATTRGRSRTAFVPAGGDWQIAERLRNFMDNFPYIAEDYYAAWLRYAKARASDAGLPFATTPGARREPTYFVRPIASGDLLVTDPAFKDWLLSGNRKLAVIEMEAAGAARAVREHDQDVGLLVLRGISDFADERKAALDAVTDSRAIGAWRRYAAENAIELLLAFLASPKFPWRTPTQAAAEEPNCAAPADDVPGLPAQPAPRAWAYFTQGAASTGSSAPEMTSPMNSDEDQSRQDGRDHKGKFTRIQVLLLIYQLLAALIIALASLPLPLPWKAGSIAFVVVAGLALINLTRDGLKKVLATYGLYGGVLLAGLVAGLLVGHFFWSRSHLIVEPQPHLPGPPPARVVTVLLNKEAAAATAHDVGVVGQIYAPGAFVRDAACRSPGQSITWPGLAEIRARYRALPKFASLRHEFAQVRFIPDTARAIRATAMAQTVGFISPSATSPKGQYVHGNEEWTFEHAGGRWLITSFTYNVCYPVGGGG